jgi:hypothetical protein
MKRPCFFIPILLLMLCLSVAQAQTANHPSQINGREHPELIPDETAAALVFNAHSMTDSHAERHRAKIQFQDPADASAYEQVLRELHDKHESNRKANSEWAKNPRSSQIQRIKTDGKGTLARLHSVLTPEGYDRLITFIRAEKANMVQFGGAR